MGDMSPPAVNLPFIYKHPKGAPMHTDIPPEIFNFICVVVSPAILLKTIYEFWLCLRSRSWRGTATATITEVKKDYYIKRGGRKSWYEFPIISYTANGTSYTTDYSRRQKSLGSYHLGQTIPLRYDENDPRNFIFEDEYAHSNSYIDLILLTALCLFVCYHAACSVAGYYLDNHDFLFEQETWAALEDPFSLHQDSSTPYRSLYSMKDQIEKTIHNFHGIDQKIRKSILGKKRRETYLSQYQQSAIIASRSLADTYSPSLAEAFVTCGLDGEQDLLWQSIYCGLLNEICPAASPETPTYSLDELMFMADVAPYILSSNPPYSTAPEECTGIELAFAYAKLYAAASALPCQKSIIDKIEQGFPNYVPVYIERVNQHLQKYGSSSETPLDPEAILAVFTYMTSRYQGKDSFPDVLWQGSVFAYEHMHSRLQADPALQNQERFQEENNPLSDFEPRIGAEGFFRSKEEYYRRNSPLDYLHEWRSFIRFLE